MRALASAVVVLAFAAEAGADSLVADVSRTVPASHAPVRTMGRDYWTKLLSTKYSDPYWKLDAPEDNPELARLPLFRDCAVNYYASRKPPVDRPAWRTVADNFGGEKSPMYRAMEARSKPDKPFTVVLGPKRYADALVGEIDLDRADYEAWRGRHPNFTGFSMLSEWDNEIANLAGFVRNRLKDRPEKLAAFDAEWLSGGRPGTRREWLALARRFFERRIALYYGARDSITALRGLGGMDHIAAAWGARSISIETTNTSERREFRWETMCTAVRGAARQFGIPWSWFIASFGNVYSSDGKTFLPESMCTYNPRHIRGNTREEGGISVSLFRRVLYYAYLNGAQSATPEAWDSISFRTDPATGKLALSPRGKVLSDFHDFTVAHPDRGTTYAPIAILEPFDQAYPGYGGKAWRACEYTPEDHALDAVFFTLVPGFDRVAALKRGEEHNLHNTPFAMMHDVFALDAPQDPEARGKALAAYPAAILTGSYDDIPGVRRTLERYVRDGGTLLLDASRIGRDFETEFTGVSRSGKTFTFAGEVTDEQGARFAVTADHEIAELSLSGARPFLRDGSGRPLATVRDYGKGRVIVAAALHFTPRMSASTCADTYLGKLEFPFLSYFLGRFQRELLPVAVRGRALYGVNRTAHGWLLWCFNNDGVTKYGDQFERIDPRADSQLSVRCDGLRTSSVRELVSGREVPIDGGCFKWRLPAGDLAVFELK